MPIKPITPQEIVEAKKLTIPDAMIEAANQLIIKYWNGHSSTLKLKELVSAYRKIAGSDAVSDKKLSDYHWLDIEPTFREVGWKVKYASSGMDEYFDDYFEFTK